jgi:hypothetical protein
MDGIFLDLAFQVMQKYAFALHASFDSVAFGAERLKHILPKCVISQLPPGKNMVNVVGLRHPAVHQAGLAKRLG